MSQQLKVLVPLAGDQKSISSTKEAVLDPRQLQLQGI